MQKYEAYSLNTNMFGMALTLLKQTSDHLWEISKTYFREPLKKADNYLYSCKLEIFYRLMKSLYASITSCKFC